jgi:hypothetical protein
VVATVPNVIRKTTTVLLAVSLWLHALFFLNFQPVMFSEVGRLLHLTSSEAILFGLVVALSFLSGSGFWRMLGSLAYIYFFPFVLFWYFLRLCVVAIRYMNRWIAARIPGERDDLTLVDQKEPATTPDRATRPVPKPTAGKARAAVVHFLSRPFRRFTVLWGVLLLVTTHLVIVWLCLIVLLLQLGQKIFFIIKVLLFSDPWLKKYGPLGFAGLNKTLETLDATTPAVDPGNKEWKNLLGRLNLWTKILAFLKNPYLLSRWAWVLAVAFFILIYTYFSFLFSFGYYGIARVSGVDFPWTEALTTSMFLPFYATDLPKLFWIRLLGGIQGSLILAIGIGTVMNFLRRKLEAVRETAAAFSDRVNDQIARGKYLTVESGPSTALTDGVQFDSKQKAVGDDERFAVELSRLRVQISTVLSSESPESPPVVGLEASSSGVQPHDSAREFYDLGKRHESRLEWPDALAAFRRAWELERIPKYGLEYASLARRLNYSREALKTFEEIIELLTDPAERASTMSSLGMLYVETRSNKADQAFAAALEILRKLAEAAPDSYQFELAQTLNDTANLYYGTGRSLEAEMALLEALSIQRRLVDADAERALPRLAATLDNLGLVYSQSGQDPKANESFQEALDIRRKLAEADSWGYLPAVARTLSNFAIHRNKTQQVAQAELMFEEALAIRRALTEISPSLYLSEKATDLQNLGVFYADANRIPMAENCYCAALGDYRRLAEIQPDQYLPEVASTLNCLGGLYGDTQKTSQAEEAFGEALEIRRRLSATAPEKYLPEVVTTLGCLAWLYLSTKRSKMASAQASEAERLLDPLWQANPAFYGDQMARILLIRSQIHESILSSSSEAITFAERALEVAYDLALKEEIRSVIESLRFTKTP